MEEKMDAKLEQEYDNAFEGEEKVLNVLDISSDSFTRKIKTISTKKIGLSEALKQGRSDTLVGLSKSIEELGVLTPIHVMTMEDTDEDDEEDDYQYQLIDGLRRLYGALKCGISEVEAIVWDFKDKALGRKFALTLSLVLNRTQKRSWKEVWDLYKILELQFSVTPGTLEYLLQLESGDAMKLKDCMLCDYNEVKEEVLLGEKSLDQCYKLLQKLRKEENALEKEENTGLRDKVDGAEDISINQDTQQDRPLDDNEVRELLDMADDSIKDVEEEDFKDMNVGAFDDEHQKVGDRHPVDQAIKSATLQRDEFKCQCCGTGGVAFLGVLVYHHKIPVHCGGADTVENGLTLCSSCHIQLHIYEKNGGKIAMTKEQFDSYDDEEQIRIKKILKYAKVAVESAKRRGMSKEEIQEGAKAGTRHMMPGEGLKDNERAFATATQE